MNIIQKNFLTQNEYQDVVQLLKECEKHDGFTVSASINLSMLQKAEGSHLDLLLSYDEEDSKLVGFLGVYSFVVKTKVELAGMIHPDHRKAGRFTEMLNKALEICKERGADEILYVCPGTSDEAKSLMHKIDATYSFSEYTMEYKETASGDESPILQQKIEFLLAEEKDVEIIGNLLSDGFHFEHANDSVTPLLERNRTQEGFELYIIKYEGKEIATLTISIEESSMYISAFTVTPSKRGKGIGREILRRAIKLIQNNYPAKKIRLDVDVKNINALKLYVGVGFQIRSGYDYFLHRGEK
ncbi:GNAT family N-acetyltransferase [Sutcliffiella sp. NPDC057660]|uniref:GNAT family N-acetyltransferase n=1 Tax=Sutcliffiella sp. NPDC057660 TaxID=3346199 RepID=UPI0036B812E4